MIPLTSPSGHANCSHKAENIVELDGKNFHAVQDPRSRETHWHHQNRHHRGLLSIMVSIICLSFTGSSGVFTCSMEVQWRLCALKPSTLPPLVSHSALIIEDSIVKKCSLWKRGSTLKFWSYWAFDVIFKTGTLDLFKFTFYINRENIKLLLDSMTPPSAIWTG